MKNSISKNLYLISALNENSLTLAKSISGNDPGAKIFFAGLSYADNRELRLKAKALGCKVYPGSIQTFDKYKTGVNFTTRIILNNNDENVNVNDALFLSEKCRNKINAEIYVFASSKESECLLDAINKESSAPNIRPLKIRRVNPVRTRIYNELFSNSIFDKAVEVFGEKVISVMIVGLGNYGTEMLKALLWCGQMTGYVLKINVFDISENACEKFYLECPGILQRGTFPKNGEDYYEINFYPGTDVFTESFYQTVTELSETTHVFISLGSEQKNIETALKLRSVFSGMMIESGKKPLHSRQTVQTPEITTVIHNNRKAEMLNRNELCNFKNQYYNIRSLGSDDEMYSYENIFASQLEELAFKVHCQWGDEESFNNFEYYRRSSMSSAIHKKYRDELLPDDNNLKAMNEHMRWNAYMRSVEGYSFGYVRDDLALRHSSLVKFSTLNRVEKEKDVKADSFVK